MYSYKFFFGSLFQCVFLSSNYNHDNFSFQPFQCFSWPRLRMWCDTNAHRIRYTYSQVIDSVFRCWNLQWRCKKTFSIVIHSAALVVKKICESIDKRCAVFIIAFYWYKKNPANRLCRGLVALPWFFPKKVFLFQHCVAHS